MIHYARADRSVPPFVFDVVLTAGPGDTHPKMAYDFRQTLWLLFQRASGSAFDSLQIGSTDDGFTWGMEAMAFSGGKYPTVASSSMTGTIIRAAWVSNQIQANRQEPGSNLPGSVYTFKDQTGSTIQAADDSFNLAAAFDAPSRWLLSIRLLGATEISDFQSWDDGETWALVT